MKKISLVCLMLLLPAMVVSAASKQVPTLFNYQGVLLDEGGNPLPDGISNLKFQISDSAGSVLYEETQDVEITKGQVSVIIGNGLNPASGAPAGGIPSDILDPTDTHYLQVEVGGQKPYDRLEIVAQPYSLWADTALGLAEGSLTGEMVGEKVIEKKHLSDELMDDLKTEFADMMATNALSQDSFKEFKTVVQASSGASQIGVVNNFVYSGSKTVQGVLSDFDKAIKKRQEEVDFVRKDNDSKITSEATTRKNSDDGLQANISNEAVTRSQQDGALQANISSEAVTRSQQDGVLQTNISNEATTRGQQDGTLQANLNNHAATTSVHGSDGAVVGMNTLNATVSAIGGTRVTLLTSGSGNWTVPSNVTSLKVTCVGGGGGGGGGSDNSSGKGGGGGGQMVTPLSFKTLAVTPGGSIAYSVGGGGAGGAGGSNDSNGASGSAGGNTTFGSIGSPGAQGGGGGGSGGGGAGVIVGSNPNYNDNGWRAFVKGENGGTVAGVGDGAPGAMGSGSYGANGNYHTNPGQAGRGGDGYGAGGGGGETATFSDGISGDAGGAGADGVIIIEY